MSMRLTWNNTDIQLRADVVRNLAGEYRLTLVDLTNLFSSNPDPSLYLEDGLHPGPAGHQLILERLLAVLAANSLT